MRSNRIRRVGLKGHGDTVHAVAQAGDLGPVVENVPKMPAAARAVHCGADHAQAGVARRANRSVIERRPETRPPGAAVKLGL